MTETNSTRMPLKGQIDADAKTISSSASIKNWRNQLLDMIKTPQTQAVIAFGTGAHQVVDLWPGGIEYSGSGGHRVYPAACGHWFGRDSLTY